MQSLRTLIRAHRRAAALLVAAALVLRILLPVGFMPLVEDGRIVVRICNAAGPAQVSIEIPGLEHKSKAPQAQTGCAFADLSLPWLAGADPIQLAALALFILVLGLAPSSILPPRAAARLRPPLRGPPLPA